MAGQAGGGCENERSGEGQDRGHNPGVLLF